MSAVTADQRRVAIFNAIHGVLCTSGTGSAFKNAHDATDAVLALTALERQAPDMRAALKPFADAFDAIDESDFKVLGGIENMKIQEVLFGSDQPTIADLRRAAEAYAVIADVRQEVKP